MEKHTVSILKLFQAPMSVHVTRLTCLSTNIREVVKFHDKFHVRAVHQTNLSDQSLQ